MLEVEKKYTTVHTLYREGIIAQVAGKTFTSEETFVTKRTEKISSTRLLDHREQPPDDSQSDDGLSHYSSISTATSRSTHNGLNGNGSVGPVVQIQSYADRDVREEIQFWILEKSWK